VFRCLECSFIFSPPEPLQAEKPPAAQAPQWPLSWEALARYLASQAGRAEEV
jgi:rubredoxin